jgi:UDP-glucose 4-epimerase
MVIPRFIAQALKNEPLTVYGTGKQSRCFVHVKDASQALIKLMEEPKAIGEVFNIGSQEEITIEQLAKEIIKLTGSSSKIKYIPYEKAYEEGFEDMQRRVPDIAKAGRLIGFKPSYTLPEIIKDIILYLKKENK